MELETLSLSVEAGIAHVKMLRAESLNTMVPAFWDEMIRVFGHIEDDPGVRAVILSSGGRHFTAGLDLKTAGGLTGGDGDVGRQRVRLLRTVKHMQRSFSALDQCRVPVIAVVQGGCIGAGVDLVTACDMRIAAADAFFAVQEINVGIVADVGTLQRMPHLLPQGIVRELAYTGRRMGVEEAARYGFVNQVAATREAALEAAEALAAEIAAKSPMAVMGTKAVLNAGRGRTVEEGLEHVALWNSAFLPGADVEEALDASAAKRSARFEDLG